MPETPDILRSLRLADEQLAALAMLCSVEDDLAAQVTQTSNHFHGLLTQIHSGTERTNRDRARHAGSYHRHAPLSPTACDLA